MEGKQSESRHFMLWLCVGLCAVMIFGGWLMSVRASLIDLSRDLEDSAVQNDGSALLDDSFSKIQAAITETENLINQEKEQSLASQVEQLKKQTEELNKKLNSLPAAEVKPPAEAAPAAPQDKPSGVL